MEVKSKRGRPAKKEISVEVNNVEAETVKNGGEPADPIEDKKKPGRKGKAAAPVVADADPLDNVTAAPEEPSKGRKGRKPASAKEEVVAEVPAKKGRGKKAVEEVVAAPAKKGKAVENGTSSPVKGKGRGKGSSKDVEPEAAPEVVAAPAKRGRGKAKADTTEPEEEIAPSPVKKSKQSTKEPSPKKASPKKVDSEAVSEEPKAAGRGRKKAVDEKPASPAKSPAAPVKRGRGKKAATEPEANEQQSVLKVTKKSTRKQSTEEKDALAPLNGVTQRRKKKAEEPLEQDEDAKQSTIEPKAKKSKSEKKPAAPKMNKSATDFTKINFDLLGKEYNYKIASWNVAGLRGLVEKGAWEYVEHEKPDILCVQETKCTEEQLPDAARHIKGYHPYWLCKPGGYAGVAIYSKKMPFNVTYGLGDEEQDADGRLLTAEYEKFYLVCVYVPNAGRKLVTLPKRLRWDEKFHQYLKELDAKKPVIVCGDMNVAHEEIDLTNPKTNKKNAGFTQEERDGMTKLLSLGFVDTFRQLYPEQKGAYTFWSYMGNARSKNVGWRLDYFITSERLVSKVVDNVMRSEVYGSDHCPLTLFLNI
ncbi:DNA-(apurinic or apyrimidinic site) endonuclease isoform X2 [Topomyia yanbarensis]|uniref:DNA-(apurinic or apyrimidinic site) endonuclease isoform X2 n=1 Tax=Topomyia yanbarensis TaxID=2498891 RepID=UPI00273BCE0D|nr:DNA-(apurinic or apyrimidinic site) endonuclease isoform X2 [Topomyia yanbarensis]